MREYNILQEAIEETESETTIDALEKRLQIDFSKVVEKPPTLLSVIDQAGNISDICTSGNFSMIIGKAKSRKSFFLSALIVASIKGDSSMSNIKGSEDAKPMAIMFDTEMSEFHSQRMGQSVMKQLPEELKPHYLHYMLRELPPNERLDFVEKIIIKYHKYISLVVIDGIKDLLSQGINDEPESISLTSRLMKWTTKYDIHIVCVLHQNKNDKNARGHIGSELSNKAETVLQIEKDIRDTNISTVSPVYTRGLDFEPFAFKLELENFTPECVDHVPQLSATDEKLVAMFAGLFLDKNHYTYTSLANTIVESTKKTLPAAKKNIASGIKKGIITKKGLHYTYCYTTDDTDNAIQLTPNAKFTPDDEMPF